MYLFFALPNYVQACRTDLLSLLSDLRVRLHRFVLYFVLWVPFKERRNLYDGAIEVFLQSTEVGSVPTFVRVERETAFLVCRLYRFHV